MKSNEELLEQYENLLAEVVKAANGWNRKSEKRLSRELDELRSEILRRMGPAHKK